MNIRFVDHIDPDQVIHDVEMSSPPVAGEHLRFRFQHGEEQLFTVESVEHVFDVRIDRLEMDKPLGAVCTVKPRYS